MNAKLKIKIASIVSVGGSGGAIVQLIVQLIIHELLVI